MAKFAEKALFEYTRRVFPEFLHALLIECLIMVVELPSRDGGSFVTGLTANYMQVGFCLQRNAQV